MKFFLLAGALVTEPYLESAIEIGHLSQIAGNSIVFEFDLREDRGIGREGGLGTGKLGGTPLFDLALGHAAFITLEIHRALLAHLDFKLFTQRVDNGRTDTMQTAGNFVHTAIEFAAGM